MTLTAYTMTSRDNQVLSGIRVLDFGSFITAPYAAMLLGELGADVIKVERPGSGDPFRAFNGGLYSSHFQAHNRNKRSVALEHTAPGADEALEALVRQADVLLLNVRPGVEDKIGLGCERLQALNPGLVYCSITGYGASGPYAERAAYDNVGQSLSGWLSMFHQGTDARVPGPAVSDALTGMYAAMGILAALAERGRTGRGRKVEVSMLESMIAFATEPLGKLFSTGQPLGFYARAAASQSFIVTCADGLRIGLHMSSPPKFWEGLAKAMERPDIFEDPRFATRDGRMDNQEAMIEVLSAIFKTRTRVEWCNRLVAEDVPHAPMYTTPEVPEDPQVQHLELFVEAPSPKGGTFRTVRSPVSFDGQRSLEVTAPPLVGQHNAQLAGKGWPAREPSKGQA